MNEPVNLDEIRGGDGLRATRTTGANTTTFTWGINTAIPQILDDGTFRYVYGLGRVSEVGPGTTTHYYLLDDLGSTMALVDSAGAIVNNYSYDVFGSVRSSSGSQANLFRFAGEEADDPAGLVYLRERYYDPVTGRFLSPDPFGGGYAYARNNPVNLIDPSGLIAVCNVWSSPDGKCIGTYECETCAPGTGFIAIEAEDEEKEPHTVIIGASGDVVGIQSGDVHGLLTFQIRNEDEGKLGSIISRLCNIARAIFDCGPLGGGGRGGGGSPFRFTFGTVHAAPHIAKYNAQTGANVSSAEIEAAIRNQVSMQVARVSNTVTGQDFWGRVLVQGTVWTYRGYTLPDGTIHIGTYYPP
jgi:RHS repeat-associated protein